MKSIQALPFIKCLIRIHDLADLHLAEPDTGEEVLHSLHLRRLRIPGSYSLEKIKNSRACVNFLKRADDIIP